MFIVMAGLVPAIHVLAAARKKTWMPGTGPGMTMLPGRSATRPMIYDVASLTSSSAASASNSSDASP